MAKASTETAPLPKDAEDLSNNPAMSLWDSEQRIRTPKECLECAKAKLAQWPDSLEELADIVELIGEAYSRELSVEYSGILRLTPLVVGSNSKVP